MSKTTEYRNYVRRWCKSCGASYLQDKRDKVEVCCNIPNIKHYPLTVSDFGNICDMELEGANYHSTMGSGEIFDRIKSLIPPKNHLKVIEIITDSILSNL